MSNLIPSIEVLSKLPSKLILSFFNDFQIIFVGSAKFLELSDDLELYLLNERNDLLFDLFIDNVYFDLLIPLSSLQHTLDNFCDLLMILFLFFFFEELLVHDFIDFFMQYLVQFSLLYITIVLQLVEFFWEWPEIASEVEPTSQCELLTYRCSIFPSEI